MWNAHLLMDKPLSGHKIGFAGLGNMGRAMARSYLVSADTVNTSWIQKDDSPIVEASPFAFSASSQ